MSDHPDSTKSIFFALAANVAIALAKLGAAIYTGSSAMLAESVHSLADCGNQGLLIWGIKAAKTPPSPDYPLGWGKAIYFWSFIVAVMLFSVGGLFSVYEGVRKLGEQQELEAPWLALAVLGFSICAEGASLWRCLGAVNKARGKRSLWRWARETRQSELLVVVGEDLAALAGLAIALLCISLTILTENTIFDALGSIMVGLLLIAVAIFVGTAIKGLLIGQSVEPATRQAIVDHLVADAAVKQVFNLITLQLGNDVMVAVKAEIAADSARAMVDEINRLERQLKTAFPQVKWLFFEPDCTD